MAECKPIPCTLSAQDIERFWIKVDKTPGYGPWGDCWLWTGSRFNGTRYGQFSMNHRYNLSAHKISYFLATGKDPFPLFVLHTCDIMHCVNDAHLYRGTNQDNMADMVRRGRAATGERNSSHLYPERVARGIRNGAYTHPERVLKGSASGNAKLTEAKVLDMRQQFNVGNISRKELAIIFGVSYELVVKIINRSQWRHI